MRGIQTTVEFEHARAFELIQAVMLYRGSHFVQYAQVDSFLATVHPVRQEPEGPVLGAGQLLSQEAFYDMLKALNAPQAYFLPEHVLACSAQLLVWWEPARRRRMYFHPSNLMMKEFSGVELPHPPLVFVCTPRNMCVFALKHNRRPDLDTQLSVAPYFNVNASTGLVCLGDTVRPDALRPDLTEQWSTAFFESYFTHATGPLTSFKKGYAGLLHHLQGKRRFHPGFLLDGKKTLREVVG